MDGPATDAVDAPGTDATVTHGPATGGPGPHHLDRPWLGRRRLMAAYAAFGAYAVAAAVLSAGEDQVWAIWAACGYPVALVMLWRWRGRIAAVLVSVALAVLAPLLWLSVAYPLEDGMAVIDRSAALLLHHGLPYLSGAQVVSWLSYNPYLPVMTFSACRARPGSAAWPGTPGCGSRSARWSRSPRRSGSRRRTGAAPRAAATRCWPPPSRWPRR